MTEFATPRVFEYTDNCATYRVEIENDTDAFRESVVKGNGYPTALWTLAECLADVGSSDPCAWTEITKPFDPATLDWSGVGHVEETRSETKWFYCASDPRVVAVEAGPDIHDLPHWIEFPRPDIANQTIADLRRKVAELENKKTIGQKIVERLGDFVAELKSESEVRGE
jgi:hypothetical protein